MNNQFDELTKGVAQSVTRRGALKKFALGVAGMGLACFGLANKAEADQTCASCKKACRAAGGSPQRCKDVCYLVCHGYDGP